jgi:hypothetical protein
MNVRSLAGAQANQFIAHGIVPESAMPYTGQFLAVFVRAGPG